jgi:hypothetical protein
VQRCEGMRIVRERACVQGGAVHRGAKVCVYWGRSFALAMLVTLVTRYTHHTRLTPPIHPTLTSKIKSR